MSILPGMHPGHMIAVAGGVSISVFGSSTSTGSTIDVPANVQTGDLIVLLDKAYHGGLNAPNTNVPTDFTSISNLSLVGSVWIRQILSYKLAVGTEGGATLSGMDGAIGDEKALYVFRRTPAATSLVLSTPNEQITTGDPTAQNVAASGGTAPLVVIGAYGARTETIDPRTFSTTKDGEVNPNTTLYLAYKIYNSSPADTSIDMADEGGVNILQSLYIEMA